MDELDDLSLGNDQELALVDVDGPDRQSMLVIIERLDDDSFALHVDPRRSMMELAGLRKGPSLVYLPGDAPQEGKWFTIKKVLQIFASQQQDQEVTTARSDEQNGWNFGRIVVSGKKAVADLIKSLKSRSPFKPKEPAIPPFPFLGPDDGPYDPEDQRNPYLRKPLPPVPAVEDLDTLAYPTHARRNGPRLRKPVVIRPRQRHQSFVGSLHDAAASPSDGRFESPRPAPPVPTRRRIDSAVQSQVEGDRSESSWMEWD